MKNDLSIVVVLSVVAMIGCSKKAEECPPLVKIFDTYEKSITPVQIGGNAEQDLATAIYAGTATQQSEQQLNALKLTDENLIAVKGPYAELFKNTGAILNEIVQTLTSAAQAKQKAAGVKQGLDEGLAALKAACEKKERWKKSRTAKKEQCDAVNAQLNALTPDTPDADKLKSAVDALKTIKLTFSAVSTAVETIIAKLQEKAEPAAAYAASQQKAVALKPQLEQQKAKILGASKELRAYCAP